MPKKVLTLWDLLEPPTITIAEYEDRTIPFTGDSWIESSDQTILEIAKLLPYQLSFIYSILHEYPELLPVEKQVPGWIQELLYHDIMKRLESNTDRDRRLERKITELWIKNGGIKPVKKRREK